MHNHINKNKMTNEKKTLIVIVFTLITMTAEIIYGYITNSMALLADGYHMATHVLALILTYITYLLIKKFENSAKFPNGTDKIGTLSAYTSSLFLGLTGLWIIYEAINRFLNPLQIHFEDAIIVAIIGLVVNGICIFIMEEKEHSCHHHHHHEICEDKKDYNFKAAYFHILADAMTSILAIFALFAAKYFNLIFLDSIMGFVGGILILKWAFGLLKNTIKELIDMRE